MRRVIHTRTETSPLRAAMDQAAIRSTEDVPVVCFDTETGPVRMGHVRRLADVMGASYYRRDELEPRGLSEAVNAVFGGSDGSLDHLRRHERPRETDWS